MAYQRNQAPEIGRRGSVSYGRTPRLALIFQPILFLLMLLAGSASGAETENTDSYRLAAGDKISIAVLGQKELSGDVTLDAAGNLNMLIVGRLQAKGLTITDVERQVTARLADGYLKQPVVSVRVSELRPVYVLGSVRRPGKYPFNYGETIKSLLAIAGGLGSPDNERSSVPDFLTANERVNILKQNRRALKLRLARLEAQRDGLASFMPPVEPEVTPDSNDIVFKERETFETQGRILQSQLTALREQTPRLRKQIEALNGELATTTKQIDLAQKQVERYDQLAARGLGRNETAVGYLQSQTRAETERWRITGELSKLEFNSGELDFKINEIETTFKQRVSSELETTRERLKELEISLPASVEIRDRRLIQAGGAAGRDPSYVYQVTRVRDRVADSFEAKADALLEPGDLVEVKLLNPDDPILRQSAEIKAPTAN